MGTYAYLTVGRHELLSMRNDLDDGALSMFTERDRLVGKSVTDSVVYQCRVGAALDRLEIQGFTVGLAEEVFPSLLCSAMTGVKSASAEDVFGCTLPGEKLEDAKHRTLKYLTSYTYDRWRRTFRACIKYPNAESKSGSPSAFTRHGGGWMSRGFLEGFPLPDDGDTRYFLAAALSSFDVRASVRLDLAEFSEFYGADDEVCGAPEPILVLTEGKTDADFLERALRLLYPHAYEFYSFMDFEGAGLEGGASRVVHYTRAFVAAKMRHRIVALFDNDTAGIKEQRALTVRRLPAHVRALRLPDIPQNCSYPTVGPQENVRMNVNGLAASLELYFPPSTVKNAGGKFEPVQWTGYDQKMKRYQGQVINKDAIQHRQDKLLDLCKSHPAEISKHDWSGLRAVFRLLFGAFATR